MRNVAFDPKTACAFTPKGVVTDEFFKSIFVPFFNQLLEQHQVEGPTLLVLDSCRSHITASVLSSFCLTKITLLFSGGTTSLLQWIDVYYAGPYKAAHVKYWNEEHTTKRTAAENRKWLHCTVAQAHTDVISTMDVTKQFKHLGYLNPSIAEFHSPHLSNYNFENPTENLASIADHKK